VRLRGDGILDEDYKVIAISIPSGAIKRNSASSAAKEVYYFNSFWCD